MPSANYSLEARRYAEALLTDDDLQRLRSGQVPQEFANESLSTDENASLVQRTAARLIAGTELQADEAYALEAIILPDKRPPIDIENGAFVIASGEWSHLYTTEALRRNIERALPSVGRIELVRAGSSRHIGTGFVVGDSLMMTNRHVAQAFAAGIGTDGLRFVDGTGAEVDFKREYDDRPGTPFAIHSIVMVHPYWDMALLRVEGLDRPPLTLSASAPGDLLGRDIVVVGYPACDMRAPQDVQQHVFKGRFGVKRLSPGKVGARRNIISFEKSVSALTHDSSTLGGSSGSAVLDPVTGNVVALHFAGRYLDCNFAVPANELARDRHVASTGVSIQAGSAADDAATRRWWNGTAPASAGRAEGNAPQRASNADASSTSHRAFAASAGEALLSGAEVQAIVEIICDYLSLSQIRQAVYYQLEVDLDEIALGENKTEIVFRLVEHSNRHRLVGRLCIGIASINPATQELLQPWTSANAPLSNRSAAATGEMPISPWAFTEAEKVRLVRSLTRQFVDPMHVSTGFIRSYGKSLDANASFMLLIDANRLRCQADPEMPPHGLIVEGMPLLNLTGGEDYWGLGFQKACALGGRMLGSLLISTPPNLFEANREHALELLAQLKEKRP